MRFLTGIILPVERNGKPQLKRMASSGGHQSPVIRAPAAPQSYATSFGKQIPPTNCCRVRRGTENYFFLNRSLSL